VVKSCRCFPTLEAAREKAQAFKLASSSKSVNKFENASLMNLMGKLKTGTLQHLKVVLKSDSNGSLEASQSRLSKRSLPKMSLWKSSTLVSVLSMNLMFSWLVRVLPYW
jgi:translation initiation factor IF-2